jgi:hypothetical protein
MLHLHPAKMGSSLKDWWFEKGKRNENFLKKNFKKHLPVTNKFSTFAPALQHKRNKN